eukprot:748442-Prymnesium_polylepis.1
MLRRPGRSRVGRASNPSSRCELLRTNGRGFDGRPVVGARAISAVSTEAERPRTARTTPPHLLAADVGSTHLHEVGSATACRERLRIVKQYVFGSGPAVRAEAESWAFGAACADV